MFYHDHGLAVHLNNCYFLGKLDLHSTQIFLNRCLQNYDKIPADDRDHSVDDSSEHVRELLEEVTEERHKLTASLKSSTHKEYVESCLALGSIDNNSELLPHLQECSGQDKKHLGQLLWCTQLVRLVISLEEAALGLTFQRAEIPAQNETCLARAYHLVQHGEPSKGDSKRPNPEHKPDSEEVLYGGAKERVRSTIYSEVVQYKMSLEQKLTVLTLLSNDTNTLAQVSTGEGKSLIVVAVAIIKASQGQKVDIITSSSVLAKRDAEQSKSIYAKFGINVSHNCSEDIEKRKEAYSGNQVVYGDLSSFQRDYLLHKFYQKNVLGDRDFVNVIVDEVDSMLLDRGNNMLYLSHDLPDMDKLESVYVFIWEWVNNISKVYDTAAIRDAVLWQIYGVLKCTDIGKIDATLSEEKRNFIWNKLVEAKIIDGNGKLITENIKNDVLGELLGSEYSVYLDRLEYLLTEYINREKCIHVPNYLRSFVDLHLESWIEAAKMALVMEAGHDYVVDVDRSGSSADRTPNITILDRDTGTDLVNSQWEAALHQFVQLKHGCKTYLQSLKAVFISNVTFFKLYDKLYGLSGTLGSHRERDLLGEIYCVNFVNIPTAKCKLFYEDVPIVCKSAAEWTDAIIVSTVHMTQRRQRSVLIICETLNDVTALYKAFEGKTSTYIRTYTREYEEFDIGELPPGQIIIATNLAGRGTDIKITPELKKAGGVHVCLTYLPSNIRVEQQAFGRAARCGDRGSGQLIVLDLTESANVMQLKRERDSRELCRISLIKAYYETRIAKEETCFKMFTEQYDELRKLLSTSAVTKGDEKLIEILLSCCLDRWVYWLDKNGKNLVDNSEQRSRILERSLDDFLVELKSLNAASNESLLEWVDTSIPRMIRLGQYLAVNKQRELAHKLFDKAIAMEPQFSEGAYYYKAYALSTEINMTAINEPKIQTFSQLLRKAAHLFDERCVHLMANVIVVERIKTNFKNNILPITAYKEQKQTICKFYGSLTQSIDAILDASNRVKEILRERLETIFQQVIHKPVLEKGSFLLMNYAERCIELKLGTEEEANASEDFTKKVQIEKLKKEAEKKRQAQAMTPVENLLDQQFNEALAKWKQSSTELERLAVCIRRGKPIDVQYLELCLDAARFVLLRRAVVISSICVNLANGTEARKTYSSPLNFKGIANDLHLKDNKFRVGQTGKTPGKPTPDINCLYDCLLGSIFELRSISSKQFALEISQHLVKMSENETNTNPCLKTVLDLSKPSTIRELCFAQFCQTCFECPSRGVIAYGDLLERAKNRKNYASDWHGRGGAHRVEVVSCYGSQQFVNAGFRRNASTDTIYGKSMSDLREAFLAIRRSCPNEDHYGEDQHHRRF
ncbi:helicase conserved C-terminal domain containing protein [Culex quinquefasciatus]|uniref:Helicase conserved C-terminal domain containing protein n=1 Tax=Culex quinquefasciatus TaxID=7176 RepID=B0XEZ1_CULQU|nr:helicase conserved C-terminal domain containing protein [Culex quinquefasciatus]|eukprot:XP_001868213.1 helicase conserved C-terminal domain containing protein [Culex quinquefasciatus]